MDHLDEVEARSGPSAKRRLSMHSSEGAVSEGGDSLDSLSLQDFQGSASDEEKEEGAASGEEKEYTIRDVVVMVKNNIAIMEEMQQASMDRQAEKWTPR